MSPAVVFRHSLARWYLGASDDVCTTLRPRPGTAAMSATESAADVVPAKRTFTLQGGAASSSLVVISATIAFEAVLWFVSFWKSSPWMAWGIAALNVAGLAWMWYAYRPGRRATLRIDAGDVELVFAHGIRCRFRRDAVATAELATWRSVPDGGTDYLNTAHPLEPNVLMTLAYPIYPRFAIGIYKRCSRIGVRVEDPDAVLAMFRVPIASGQSRS